MLPCIFSEDTAAQSAGMSSIIHDDSLSVSSFRKTLVEETQRLTVLCTQWSDILDCDSDGKINDTAKVFVVLQSHVHCLL